MMLEAGSLNWCNNSFETSERLSTYQIKSKIPFQNVKKRQRGSKKGIFDEGRLTLLKTSEAEGWDE